MRVGLAMLVGAVGCGPSLAHPEMGGGGSGGSGDGETGGDAAGVDPDDSSFPTEICPCDRIVPDRTLCDGDPTPYAESLLASESLAPLDGFTARVATDGTSLFFEKRQDQQSSILQWSEAEPDVHEALQLGPGADLLSLAGTEGTLFALTEDPNDGVCLRQWTAADALQTIACLGELDVPMNDASGSDGQLRIGFGHALIASRGPDHFQGASWITDAVFDIEIQTGVTTLIADPLAGAVSSEMGWLGLRATTGEYQRCYDYACFRDPIPTAWSFVSGPGTTTSTIAADLCVEEDEFGKRADHAFLTDGGYVFAAGSAIRRIREDGVENEIWRGHGQIRRVVLANDGLFVSTHHEPDNLLFRVPLDGTEATLVFREETSHMLRNFHPVGVLGPRLFVAAPIDDGDAQLVALTLP